MSKQTEKDREVNQTPTEETVPPSAAEQEAAETSDAGEKAEESEAAAALEEQLKVLLAEKDEMGARLLRLQADFDNFRRRSSKDSEDAIHRAAAQLIGEFLPVLDNFERAWNVMSDGPDKDGVGLIGKQFLSVLQNAGLQEIQAEGADFDPKLHQAVSQADAGPEQKGKVTMVLQKGYLLKDRLLRAAMVQVGQ